MTAVVQPKQAVIASLLESRAVCIGIGGAALAHVAMVATGLGGWPCPMLQATGIPCPGCGLGRACALLLKGDFSHALRMHAFAPFALGAVALFCLAAVLPEPRRLGLARSVGVLEGLTWITPVILSGVVLYWLLRFTLDGGAFTQLVK